MSQFVRASKFRHVYSDPPKPENTWSGFRLATTTGEQCYIKGEWFPPPLTPSPSHPFSPTSTTAPTASAKYFAVAVSGGGGPFVVCDLKKPGRYDASNTFKCQGHSSSVLDFEWSPFDDDMIASASDDSTIKVRRETLPCASPCFIASSKDLRSSGRSPRAA